MKKAKKWWIPLLLCAMLIAALVGVVWARPKSQLGASSYKVTIPGSAFHPNYDGMNWYAGYGNIHMDGGSGEFTAAVPMPPGRKTVQKVILFVDDANATQTACVSLERLKVDGTSSSMAYVCSPVGTSGGIQSYSDETISPSIIRGRHTQYLYLDIYGTNIDVWAVRIVYD
ncbi:MAG: hypothetical protein GTO63_27890 [Anaerolineae bacterium]|nr:hypothetical protein [Anaerolineae bacterium]NIQ81451.1 hypothetical protein [Anaerolineae bacterium]